MQHLPQDLCFSSRLMRLGGGFFTVAKPCGLQRGTEADHNTEWKSVLMCLTGVTMMTSSVPDCFGPAAVTCMAQGILLPLLLLTQDQVCDAFLRAGVAGSASVLGAALLTDADCGKAGRLVSACSSCVV